MMMIVLMMRVVMMKKPEPVLMRERVHVKPSILVTKTIIEVTLRHQMREVKIQGVFTQTIQGQA